MSSMSWSAPSHSRRLLHSRCRRSLSTKTSKSQISWARKKASKNASRLARTRLKHHKITVFDFPPFSPCFLKLFSQLLLAQPHLSAGIG